MRRIIEILLRLALAIVFFAAGMFKLSDTRAFALEIANYHFLPALALPLAVTLPTIQLIVGVGLLLPARSGWFHAAQIVGAGLLAMFTIAVGQVVARGINVDCGCFGGNSGPVTALTLLRDVALLALAFALFWITAPERRTLR